MTHLAAMFEFPTYMDISRAKMNVVKEELDQLKNLWGIVQETQNSFAEFNKVRAVAVCCRCVLSLCAIAIAIAVAVCCRCVLLLLLLSLLLCCTFARCISAVVFSVSADAVQGR